MQSMKISALFTFVFLSITVFSQTKNFIDMPYIETSAKVDTLVVPDQIYLTILISEADSKGKITLEEMEEKMGNQLKSLGINLQKQLFLNDLSSNFKTYFLKQSDVVKTKAYTLLVDDAKMAGRVIVALEGEKLSKVHLEKTVYSNMENLKRQLKSKAVQMAKQNAQAMVEPLNQKVGNALLISDVSQNNYGLAGSVSGVQIRGISKLKTVTHEPLDIEFQKIHMQSEVSVKFKLE